MRIKLLFVLFTILTVFGTVNAKENNKNQNRHEFRVFVSDGLTCDIGETSGVAVLNSLLEVKKKIPRVLECIVLAIAIRLISSGLVVMFRSLHPVVSNVF